MIFVMVSLALVLTESVLSAVVLPRPPSSPNYISQEYPVTDSKIFKDKPVLHSTNVEKPDTEGYRFLEIEFRDDDEAGDIETLDLHGLVQAVLENQHHHDHTQNSIEENSNYPNPEVVPHSILGVRDVGLGPSQRLFEASDPSEGRHYLLNPPEPTKNIGDEKLYYIKDGRPKVYVNFRGRTGNFRQDFKDPKITMKHGSNLYPNEGSKLLSSKVTIKKYNPSLDDINVISKVASTSSISSMTTESSSVVTSSELPKQIPAPPSKLIPSSVLAHTTPVHRYNSKNDQMISASSYVYTET